MKTQRILTGKTLIFLPLLPLIVFFFGCSSNPTTSDNNNDCDKMIGRWQQEHSSIYVVIKRQGDHYVVNWQNPSSGFGGFQNSGTCENGKINVSLGSIGQTQVSYDNSTGKEKIYVAGDEFVRHEIQPRGEADYIKEITGDAAYDSHNGRVGTMQLREHYKNNSGIENNDESTYEVIVTLGFPTELVGQNFTLKVWEDFSKKVIVNQEVSVPSKRTIQIPLTASCEEIKIVLIRNGVQVKVFTLPFFCSGVGC